MSGKMTNHRGQGLIEYILIVALIAVGAIGAVQLLGQTVRWKLAQISQALGARVQVHQPKGKNLSGQKDINSVFRND